ncbi:DUF6688 domain-containing protein [Aquimarina sediminis]|uniref:DUF6688 domain-containing protein n=1 Tax=Aquimarina sediminis TaxID=2070536 RepID=UPI000CA001C9|nr:DUF6688 family protein [Aquimarina sediminis]
MEGFLFLGFFGLPALIVSIDFIKFIGTGKRLPYKGLIRVIDIIVIIGLPFLYLSLIDTNTNDCCTDSATFSPDHKLTVYSLIILCALAYLYSTYKKTIVSPIIEILINSFLLAGIVLNIFIAIQINDPTWLLGNLPIILLFLLELIKNHKQFLAYSEHIDKQQNTVIKKWSWKILSMKSFFKIPILLILCIPILTIITAFLLLFGQKPDSIVSAFTDTYKHGFSQLDHMCYNVECGGHFLCSVAAKGHENIVKPTRLGERRGKPILCNRQLLISNAFEELVEQRLPKVHKVIRHNYNKVGNLIHKHYHIFNNKTISDLTYVIMKPLEWCFLITLYTFDKNPENRIAKQYLNPEHRKHINAVFTQKSQE